MGGTSLPLILSARLPHREFCRNRSRVAQAQFVPRGLRKSKTRQWAHFSPRTQWRHIVVPLMCAGNTPSPQSLRDSSPQAGEQFKVSPLLVVALLQGPKGLKGSCAEGGLWLRTAVEYYRFFTCVQNDTAQYDTVCVFFVILNVVKYLCSQVLSSFAALSMTQLSMTQPALFLSLRNDKTFGFVIAGVKTD